MPNSGRRLNACLSAGWHVHPQAGERTGGRDGGRLNTVVRNQGMPGAEYAVANYRSVTIAVVAQMKLFCAVNSVLSAEANWWPAGCCRDPAGHQSLSVSA